jgi:hypothetical protein
MFTVVDKAFIWSSTITHTYLSVDNTNKKQPLSEHGVSEKDECVNAPKTHSLNVICIKQYVERISASIILSLGLPHKFQHHGLFAVKALFSALYI